MLNVRESRPRRAAPPLPALALACAALLGSVGAPSAAADESPRRIVSLLPSLTEMLFAVGAGEQVVGVTEYCTYPPETARLEKVGGYVPASMSVERIVALRPDLVIAGDEIQAPVIDQLRSLGLAVE
ncbi:MAG: helical backbone metal receptor, partial [Acidobacteriota bacterium]